MGAPGPVEAAESRKDDGERVCCERTGRTVRRTTCSACACWAKRSRDVVTAVFCCNEIPAVGWSWFSWSTEVSLLWDVYTAVHQQ